MTLRTRPSSTRRTSSTPAAATLLATTASLRAEREGTSDGRVYTIYFRVFDDALNFTEASCQAQG